MNYIKQNLNANEEILSIGKVHWSIFLNPITLISLILITTSSINPYGFHYIYLIMLIIGFTIGLITYSTTEFALTNTRIIKKIGFIQRDIQEIKLSNIESMQMSQSILGRILNYGNVYCKGFGSSTLVIYNISKPLEFKNNVSEILSLKNNQK